MTHALTSRCCHTRDKANHRFFHVVLDPVGRVSLIRTTDLTDHDHRVRFRIIVEHLHDIDVLQTVDRVAANADCRGLPQTERGQLSNGFIGQRTRT